MASLFKDPGKISPYHDSRFRGSPDEFERALQTSSTVYVGNLSFYSTEEQVFELFSRTGEVKKIVMGLDKKTKTPCGFCFIMYYSRGDTEDAVKYITGTVLDGRPIRVDFDWGFQDGRQWGRGKSGGQVRDEFRTCYDPDRGGFGKLVKKELEVQREAVNFGAEVFGSLPTAMAPNYERSGGNCGLVAPPDQDYQRKRHREEDQQGPGILKRKEFQSRRSFDPYSSRLFHVSMRMVTK